MRQWVGFAPKKIQLLGLFVLGLAFVEFDFSTSDADGLGSDVTKEPVVLLFLEVQEGDRL